MLRLSLFSTALVVLAYHGVQAIDLKSAEEMSCIPVTKTVPVDLEWVKSHKTWYYPLMSRLDLYTSTMDVTGMSAKELSEEKVYYDSCPTFEVSDGKMSATWFNDKTKTWTLKSIKGLEHFEVEGEGQHDGTAYTVMTDNKTYSAVVFCFKTGKMSWAVLSTLKTLPMETVKQIYDHMESLGFQREQFTGLRYDQCKV